MPADLGHSLANTRSLFDHRAVSAVHRGRLLVEAAPRRRPPQWSALAACVFSGQGSQRLGMGRELYDRFPVFADALMRRSLDLPRGSA